VLVFVHGMGGSALDWWTDTPHDGVNDMYAAAYAAGYRTAFVTLDYPAEDPPHGIWTNGQRLADQLRAIVFHYGVDRVDIIAHSKGSIDAQVAVVYEDATGLVGRVFTLAAPHHGSELADLIHSWWAQWLADALGLINEATDCLQTSVMADFRATTDPLVQNQPVVYYTAAGTDKGPVGSFTWFTGLYLSLAGPNDGLVTVASTVLTTAPIFRWWPRPQGATRRSPSPQAWPRCEAAS
jgi:pimeloyl-ACP methyl ester carboxylesterase